MTETAPTLFKLPYETRRHIGRRVAAARSFRGLSTEAVDAALKLAPGLTAEIEESDGPILAEDLHLIMTHLCIGVRFFHEAAPPGVASTIERMLSSGQKAGSLAEIFVLLEGLSNVDGLSYTR